MYEIIKSRALNICMDIHGDLGKFLKYVLDEEDKLFKYVSGMFCLKQK
jgi:hypothetical protein